nr:MAG TPA_asm: capsid fiber protein [Caudoviricetes sp.]
MHNPVLIKSFEASSDIGAYHFVVAKADGTVAQASDGSKPILGAIDRNAASAGQTVDVVLLGVVEVEAAEAISAGAEVTVNEHGQAVAVSAASEASTQSADGDAQGQAEGGDDSGSSSTPAAAASVAVGLAVSTTTSAGEYVSVLLR